MNENSFYDLSIQTVKNACERFWLDKDVSYFMNHLYKEDTPVIGMDMGDEDGFYKIDDAIYEGVVQNDDVCIVTAKLVLYDTEKIFMLRENVDALVVCIKQGEEVRFSAVHMASSNQKLIMPSNVKGPSFYYRKLMKNMCDLLIETKAFGDGFRFDEEAYYKIFGEKRSFINMDQWFWHLCENFVVEQDLEKLDLFRDTDIQRRIENEDLVIDTNFRIKRTDGEIIWVRMVIVFVLDITGESLGDVFLMFTDITKEMNEKMQNLEFARTDYLTGIWNRRYTEELIEERIRNNKEGIFILFDIDKFKEINDSCGHMTGDDLLVKVSKSVEKHLGEMDVFGRLGGDEFVLWLAGSGDKDADKIRIWELFESTKCHYVEKNMDMSVHCSAGVVFVDDEATGFEELYEKADKAMYQAKGAGRNTIVIA